MSWRERFDILRARMLDYDAGHVYLENDDYETDDRPRDEPLETMVNILKDLFELVREAYAQNIAELDVLFDEATAFTNRAVAGYVSMGDAYIPSFAHAPDALLKDPLQKSMSLESKRELFKTMATFMGFDVGKVDAFVDERADTIPPWDEEQQPHSRSSVLSRFRDGVELPSSATHPRASYVWQARCEVTNDKLYSGYSKLVLSADGTFMAMSTVSGYKNRDPMVKWWALDEEDLSKKSLQPPFTEHVRTMALDDSRQLMFLADWDRVKSYSFAPETRKRAVHTLQARSHSGPLAVLPDGRLLRAGEGSALVWNIDALETHYPGDGQTFTRIGEGTYKGFEDCWRDDNCVKELSVGSAAHATLPFADSAYVPKVLHWHAPQARMLSAADTEKLDSFECVALDLEHGGKAAARYIGLGGRVDEFSTSADEPNMFLTASMDGYARLYDVRTPLPVLTIEGERQDGPMESALFVHIDGVPTIFTGGTSSQSVRLWDPRAKKLVYELSTGNNEVTSLAWHAQSTTLYALTVHGDSGGYRRARIPKRKLQPKAQPEAEAEDVEMGNAEDWQDADDDDDDEEDTVQYYDSVRWPKKAYHQDDYFGEVFDCRSDALVRYSFKENPDPDVCPAYGTNSFGVTE
ncbi:WD40 repeat domain-containing protein [Phanerochaete sordida]|uniref:WD40 repeat domain-containing protein n=1 Tax=Phanerochaete sordida TaxID=48140 RepID=A0A9P3GHX8_9APHY|nr:WD40 repeat domain-containing protein [Phanerochaete sordida]